MVALGPLSAGLGQHLRTWRRLVCIPAGCGQLLAALEPSGHLIAPARYKIGPLQIAIQESAGLFARLIGNPKACCSGILIFAARPSGFAGYATRACQRAKPAPNELGGFNALDCGHRMASTAAGCKQVGKNCSCCCFRRTQSGSAGSRLAKTLGPIGGGQSMLARQPDHFWPIELVIDGRRPRGARAGKLARQSAHLSVSRLKYRTRCWRRAHFGHLAGRPPNA